MAMLILTSAAVRGDWVACDVIFEHAQRVYFSAGVDEGVYPGSRWCLVTGDDTTASGYIAQSIIGVCHTAELENPIEIASRESYQVLVEAAVEDTSFAGLDFCLSGMDPYAARFLLPNYSAANNSQIELRTSGELDLLFRLTQSTGPVHSSTISPGCLVSYYSIPSIGRWEREISSPAPFVAVMVPNLTSASNRDGLLTTAIYYQFGDPQLWTCWPGDGSEIVNSLNAKDSIHTRQYPYDFARGRKLLGERPRSLKEVRICVQGTDLDPLAALVADLLSQQRLDVRFTNADEADIIITWLPTDLTDCMGSVQMMLQKLQESNPRYDSQREALEIAAGYLESAQAMPRLKEHFCYRAEQILVRDLGAFALFRPRVFARCSAHVQGLEFDEDGHLDAEHIRSLRLTSVMEEAMR